MDPESAIGVKLLFPILSLARGIAQLQDAANYDHNP
jgi:hypothetical protein